MVWLWGKKTLSFSQSGSIIIKWMGGCDICIVIDQQNLKTLIKVNNRVRLHALNMHSHNLVMSKALPSPNCLHLTLIQSVSLFPAHCLLGELPPSLSHPGFDWLSTAAGSCLFVPLGYRWCNQTGRSHRLAQTYADTNHNRKDREKERQKGEARCHRKHCREL